MRISKGKAGWPQGTKDEQFLSEFYFEAELAYGRIDKAIQECQPGQFVVFFARIQGGYQVIKTRQMRTNKFGLMIWGKKYIRFFPDERMPAETIDIDYGFGPDHYVTVSLYVINKIDNWKQSDKKFLKWEKRVAARQQRNKVRKGLRL